MLSCSMIEFIVFDLDGTLVDSHRDIANAANALVEELGGERLPDAAIVAMVGEGAALLVRRALAAAGIDPAPPGALDCFLTLYDARLVEHTRPYEGTVDVLTRLRDRLPVAVLTNKPQRPTERILDELHLRSFFGEVIGGDTALGRKPDPAGLVHLAQSVGVPTERTLMIGDSPVDLRTARNAGTQICLVSYGFGFRFTPEDFRGDECFADSPGDLMKAIGALE